MAAIEYKAKTASGKVYRVEDHTHLFKKPTWYLYRKYRRLYIHALVPPRYIQVQIVKRWIAHKSVPDDFFEHLEVRADKFKKRMILASDNEDPFKGRYRYASSLVVEFNKME